MTTFSRWWGSSLVLVVLALISCASPRHAASQALRTQAGAYELEVLVDGVPARTFMYGGETHVLGDQGRRYVLRVHNRSGRRIEAVVTVDGLDVIDGKPGDFQNKRGYLVEAHDFVDIDGWRLSDREAAAFRFAPIGESYAAKTGRARNVGVIGVAVFPERVRKALRPVRVPAPYDYEYEGSLGARGEGVGGGGHAEAKAQEAPAAPMASRGAASESATADRAPSEPEMRRSRGGLGTEFGEAVDSQIRQVSFVRANASRPALFLGARYNDRDGLLALGIDVDRFDRPSDLALRQSADPFSSAPSYARPPADWRRY